MKRECHPLCSEENEMGINLIIGWHSSNRREEYKFCLEKNIENPLIENIIILCEDSIPSFMYKKMEIVPLNRRPTYKDYFNFANQRNFEYTIVANADIYFNTTLGRIKKLKENEVFALSRWDVTEKGLVLFNRADSQDVWMFKGKIKDIVSEFQLGRLGCDNRLAYELLKAGYLVKNPSKEIQCCHVHKGRKVENEGHDKSETVPPPYHYVVPRNFNPFLSIVTRHYCKRIGIFEINKQSLASQEDKDFEHVILEDKVGIGSHKANLMFNQNKTLIKGDYVFMLDDDDCLITKDFVSDMKKIAIESNNPEVIFIKMDLKERVIPENNSWNTGEIHMNYIGTSCFVMRRDIWYDNINKFSDKQTGDFEFINYVFSKKPSMVWKDKIYSKVNQIGHLVDKNGV